ncbi:methyltransferase-like protein 13 [Senna tora]|uniref:Methyltransferase-like protein 13 n=1 Tax=Senna tora TaxID=362788 RepID=A0A834ST60_9FABA|nr:methyltransferase-like protein 13 [Senna tora]
MFSGIRSVNELHLLNLRFASSFSEGMVEDGYESVVNIDISSVVVEAMQNKYRDRSQLKYMQMDVRDMSAFESDSFGAIIDKGTLDSLLCGNNSRQNATMMLEEIWRVLKDKGVYILITYGAPLYRLRFAKGFMLMDYKTPCDRIGERICILLMHLALTKHCRTRQGFAGHNAIMGTFVILLEMAISIFTMIEIAYR